MENHGKHRNKHEQNYIKKLKKQKRQTALTRHRSENRQHDVLGWKDLCLGGI